MQSLQASCKVLNTASVVTVCAVSLGILKSPKQMQKACRSLSEAGEKLRWSNWWSTSESSLRLIRRQRILTSMVDKRCCSWLCCECRCAERSCRAARIKQCWSWTVKHRLQNSIYIVNHLLITEMYASDHLGYNRSTADSLHMTQQPAHLLQSCLRGGFQEISMKGLRNHWFKMKSHSKVRIVSNIPFSHFLTNSP